MEMLVSPRLRHHVPVDEPGSFVSLAGHGTVLDAHAEHEIMDPLLVVRRHMDPATVECASGEARRTPGRQGFRNAGSLAVYDVLGGCHEFKVEHLFVGPAFFLYKHLGEKHVERGAGFFLGPGQRQTYGLHTP